MSEADPKDVAKAASQAMYEQDQATRALGMTIETVEPGRAILRMTVRDDMLNGHGTCHGGLIFSLADSAFAFACNSHNRVTVAQGAQITFVEPARPGDVLIATAIERSRTRKTGLYDVEVMSADGRTIALFRGNAYEIKGQVIPEDR